MREMKDSGFDYLGTIPNSWNTISLRYLFRPSAITGRPNATVLSLYRDHGIVPKDSRDDNHNVTSLDTSKYKFVRIGDFVINKMKGWQGSMALSGYEGIVSPAYHVFKFISNKLEPKYAHYLLRSRSYTDEWHKLSTGLRVGQWDLHTNDFLKTVVPLPPLDEQRRIADHLDAKCAEIDRAVASAEASIEEYKEYERVIISEAASGPWPRVRLNRIASFHNGDRSSEYPSGNDIVSKGVPFVTSDALRGRYIARQFPKHITRIKYNRLHGAKIRLNDVVFCLRGSVGNCTFNDFLDEGALASSLTIARPQRCEGRWLNYVLSASTTMDQAVASAIGATSQNLAANQLGQVYVSLPPLDEQRRIADYLDEKCAAIASAIAAKQSIIDDLKVYKQSLIYEVVTGKREV